MRLVRVGKEKFVFHLGKREKDLLVAVLSQYPVLIARQPLSKSGASDSEGSNQRLLDEALAEQRQANKQQLRTLLRDASRLKATENGWRMSLSTADIECLLQILNDVRVGSWVILGSPDDEVWNLTLDENTAPYAWAMLAAGDFQMKLIHSLNRRKAA